MCLGHTKKSHKCLYLILQWGRKATVLWSNRNEPIPPIWTWLFKYFVVVRRPSIFKFVGCVHVMTLPKLKYVLFIVAQELPRLSSYLQPLSVLKQCSLAGTGSACKFCPLPQYLQYTRWDSWGTRVCRKWWSDSKYLETFQDFEPRRFVLTCCFNS